MRIIISCFVAGILNMGIEMVAGRMLVPVLGSSLYQWAGLIGTALASYIVGYFIHEKIFARFQAMILAIPFFYLLLVRAWFPQASNISMSFELMSSSILLSAFIIFIPSMIWAAFLPYLQSLPEVKKPAKLLAFSALGNLIGVWAVSFYLIPKVGTLKSLLFLILLSGVLSILWMTKKRAVVSLVVIISGFITLYTIASAKKEDILFHTDSAYQSITVTKDLILSMDGNAQLIYHPGETLNNRGTNNYYNFATREAEKITKNNDPSVLVLGLGGGLVPSQIKNIYPHISVDAVEIDKKMIGVAREYFQLPQSVNTINEDARLYLTHTGKKYDYIFLDTYLNSYVPFHLVTKEFISLVAKALKPGGFVIVNLLRAQEESGFLKKYSTTMAQSFSKIYSKYLEDTENTIIIATNSDLFEKQELTTFVKTTDEIFTDDLSDSDLLLFRSRKNLAVNWSGFDFF